VLTSAQRGFLKSLAHHLDPICYVGKSGLTDSLVQSVETAFDAHELLKVKFNDFKKEKREITAQLAEQTHSHLVGIIGNVAILYRQHPDEDKRKIALPN
jgi:RNA-binding protein